MEALGETAFFFEGRCLRCNLAIEQVAGEIEDEWLVGHPTTHPTTETERRSYGNCVDSRVDAELTTHHE
jgi:hypothetical protein